MVCVIAMIAAVILFWVLVVVMTGVGVVATSKPDPKKPALRKPNTPT